MRKIVITGMTAAALALGLTACGGNGGGDGGGKPAAAPPAASAPTSAPTSGDTTPSSAPSSTPGHGSNGPDGAKTPSAHRPPTAPESGRRTRTVWGRLTYVAPGKFSVGGAVFFTANGTVVYVAGGNCPDGSAPPAGTSKCSAIGLDEWAQAAPHNVSVRLIGDAATRITETQ
ncbi:hypothetical protein [Actinomadura gamaensis]|uniref:Secreted protein n=1 Tax=Actinomadura gamaensis TaxID=1763541 RepID=A0ABV9TZI3_9ACTN